MNYEKIKSIVLLVLVIISGVLTWNTWTYQPKYETIDSEMLHEISIDEKKGFSSLVKPYKVLFHTNNGHYGTVNEEKMEKVLSEMQNWAFYDFGNARSLNDEEINKLSHRDGVVEIIYPDLVPLDVYKHVLDFEIKDMPNIYFERIAINLYNQNKKETSIYFIDSTNNKVYESHLSSRKLDAFSKMFATVPKDFVPYFSYQLNKKKTIFLPENKTKMKKYTYYPDHIEPEKFKNALFPDPSFVKKNILDDSVEYTNGTSLMTAESNTSMIFYVNPAQELDLTEENRDESQLLRKSIDFVNEHGGWTDNYHYFMKNEAQQKVAFKLFMHGYPVFNEDGMADVVQYWGKEEIYKYSRPNFVLEFPLPIEKEVTLPSGKEVLHHLSQDAEIQPDMLEDLVIGYRLLRDEENDKVMILEPSWYYLYGGTWVRLITDYSGGVPNGLE